MPIEQIKNLGATENNLEKLSKNHDQLLEEAAEFEYEIKIFREKIKANREKKFLFTDKIREGEIEQEYNDMTEAIAWRESELKKIWEKINEIQAEILEAGKE